MIAEDDDDPPLEVPPALSQAEVMYVSMLALSFTHLAEFMADGQFAIYEN